MQALNAQEVELVAGAGTPVPIIIPGGPLPYNPYVEDIA